MSCHISSSTHHLQVLGNWILATKDKTSSSICTFIYSSVPDRETSRTVSFTSWCGEQGLMLEVKLAEAAVCDVVSYL